MTAEFWAEVEAAEAAIDAAVQRVADGATQFREAPGLSTETILRSRERWKQTALRLHAQLYATGAAAMECSPDPMRHDPDRPT